MEIMSSERSDKVYDAWRQSSEKFDYFILGLIGALCAYITQTYVPSRIGSNFGTLELFALLTLIASAIAGYKRVELTVMLTQMNYWQLRENEEREMLSKHYDGKSSLLKSSGETLTPEMAAREILNKKEFVTKVENLSATYKNRHGLYYRIRNLLIVAGFLLLITSKVWSAYHLT